MGRISPITPTIDEAAALMKVGRVCERHQGGRRRVAAAFRFSVRRVKVERPVGVRADLPSIVLAD